jgi:hypothetical protein
MKRLLLVGAFISLVVGYLTRELLLNHEEINKLQQTV